MAALQTDFREPRRVRPAPGRTLWDCGCLTALVLLVFAQTSSFEFLHFDDDVYVFDNPLVAGGLTLESIRWAFTTTHAGLWQPLTWLSLMLDAQLFGLDPGAFHRTNLLLHLANSLLLYFLLGALTGRAGRAAAVAALFAIHPLHVESVAWVTERKDLLFTAFGFAAIGAYLWHARRPGPLRMATVLIAAAASLMAKQMLVTLPLLLLLLDFWPLGRLAPGRSPAGSAPPSLRALLLEKLPLFALAAAFSIAVYAAQRAGGAVSGVDAVPLAMRIANVVVGYASYLVKSVWPLRLSPLYVAPPGGHALLVVAGSAALLAGVGVAVARVRHPAFRVGCLFFLVALLPVSGIVPIGLQFMADRFTYVPLVGLLVAGVWSLGDLLAARRVQQAAGWALLAVVIAASTVLAYPQVGRWRSSLALFEHAIRLDPGNWAARYYLGSALLAQRRFEEAAATYAAGLDINPNFRRARNNLAAALVELGRFEDAVVQYRLAIRAEPADPLPHANLGAALARLGRTEEAAGAFRRAVLLDPGNAQARNNLGSLLARSGMLEEARAQFIEALRLRPGYPAALANLERLDRGGGGAAGRP